MCTSDSDWEEKLSLAEMFYNNASQSSTGSSPYSLVYGREMHLPLDTLVPPSDVPAATDFLERLRSSWEAARRNLETAKASQKCQADKKRRPHSDVNVGDLVLLSTKNLALKGVTRKLAPRFVGPYRVVHTRGTAATLDLPPEFGKVHPTFHVSLLRPFKGIDDPAPQ